MTTWYTSDHHFNHFNIGQYCKRPFRVEDPSKCLRCHGTGLWAEDDWAECIHPDVDLMNEELIRRWNEHVRKDDEVKHLGDLFLGNWELAKPLIERLNGTITLIKGNHDHCTNTVYRSMGIECRKSDRLYVDGKSILLIHNPHHIDLTDYDMAFCGHVHDWWVERWQQGKRVINVGVDQHDFRPVTFEELLAVRP